VVPWITVVSRHTAFTMGVIYKFTLVWYSAKQGTMHRPMSHLMHLYTVLFFWPQDEHRRQQSRVDDIAGQGWLWWLLSRSTFVAATLGLLRVSNCWVLLDPEGGKTISWSTWRYIDSSNNCWPYDQNYWHNPCAGCNIHDVSRGGCCHHKKFPFPGGGSMLFIQHVNFSSVLPN
jgi:hypothetical protein